MTLYNKSLDQITFDDVAAFCQQRHKEGPRLDYKRDFNDDHAKLICSFANTLGGTIILGVGGNANNEPIWPPHGLTTYAGLEDRIIQVATDAIYPPVRPHIGPLLIDPSGTVRLMVVRIDGSPEAPHAIDNGRRVLVYEREGSVNRPHSLAHIDRIKYLLDRRSKYEQTREAYVRSAIDRGKRYLDARAIAARWASIIPVFPWRQLCNPELCYQIHSGIQRSPAQRAPEGSFAVVESVARRVESITSRGHMFVMEYPKESNTNAITIKHSINPNDFLGFTQTTALVNRVMFDFAKEFFNHSSVERPGLLQFDMGFLNAFGKRMWWSHTEQGGLSDKERLGRPFPDLEFRAQVTFSVEALVGQNIANEHVLFDQIKHGFDLLDD
jgi:schlafen family protein